MLQCNYFKKAFAFYHKFYYENKQEKRLTADIFHLKLVTRWNISNIQKHLETEGVMIMTIAEMRELREQKGYTLEEIADRVSIDIELIAKVFYKKEQIGQKEFCNLLTYREIHELEKVFTEADENQVAEALGAYQVKKQGEYTVEDYYALPDDKRYELIDGVLYDMAAPTVAHQEIAFEIAVALRKYIKEKGGTCKVFMAPVDVQLDKDDRTMVQPDVFILCDQSKNVGRCIYGEPDMVIEITSPSTRKKDFGKKLEKYVDAGVREYWIVDVKNQKVIVYDLGEDFGENMDLMIYGMDGEVPVGIYDGECKIDFEKIINSVVNI